MQQRTTIFLSNYPGNAIRQSNLSGHQEERSPCLHSDRPMAIKCDTLNYWNVKTSLGNFIFIHINPQMWATTLLFVDREEGFLIFQGLMPIISLIIIHRPWKCIAKWYLRTWAAFHQVSSWGADLSLQGLLLGLNILLVRPSWAESGRDHLTSSWEGYWEEWLGLMNSK